MYNELYKTKIDMYKYAIKLLNRIVNEKKDLTPEQIDNERFEIDGELYTEIFNYLQNNGLDNFTT